MYYEPALAPRVPPTMREFHDVWRYNFDQEFDALLAAVSRAGGPDAILAMDMEFPGFLLKHPRNAPCAADYDALRTNIDRLWPIQLGIAVAGADGIHHGVWTFNLHFDASVDAHTTESLTFLRSAGIDFQRHRIAGISALELGRQLASSALVGPHGHAPCWLTFSGSYDWGYLLKLLTMGRALPGLASAFDDMLSMYCPRRQELRDFLPSGSLEALGHSHGVRRWGCPHTAGSDALLTVELFMLIRSSEREFHTAGKLQETEHRYASEMTWHISEDWLATSSTYEWYLDASSGQYDDAMTSLDWQGANWDFQSQSNDEWFFEAPAKSQASCPADYQPWFVL
jgi:CCR4-NOT transcription complex subunit 7/8